MTLYAIFGEKCPAGWIMKTVDDGRFALIENSSVDTTSGALSVSHTHTVNGGGSGPTGYGTALLYQSSNTLSTDSVDIVPAGIKQVLCLAANVGGFPSGTILLSDSSSCPSGWTEYSAGNSKYIKLTETDANGGNSISGDNGAHTHSITTSAAGGTEYYGSSTSSNDVISAYTDLYHHKLMLCKKD